jgi:hypothetical protein
MSKSFLSIIRFREPHILCSRGEASGHRTFGTPENTRPGVSYEHVYRERYVSYMTLALPTVLMTCVRF